MKINDLKQRPDISENIKVNNAFIQFKSLLIELRKRELPDSIVNSINSDIDEINAISDSGRVLQKTINKKVTKIITLIEKELKLAPKNHYRNTWLALGIAVFGIPLGVAFGASFGNMAFIGIGMPIGLAIGLAIGTGMDKKAQEENRQLDIEIKQ